MGYDGQADEVRRLDKELRKLKLKLAFSEQARERLENHLDKQNSLFKTNILELDSALADLERQIVERKRIEESLRIAKEQAELLARTDQLTGLSNRREFITFGEQEIKRAIRFSHPLSVMMLDLDHFKRVNDTFGHAAGDEVIKTTSKIARNCLREVDILARIGGEEFAAVLPETLMDMAVVVAERIREEISLTSVMFGRQAIRQTVSVGVAQLARQDTGLLMSVVGRADRALYNAKLQGRNVVVPDNLLL